MSSNTLSSLLTLYFIKPMNFNSEIQVFPVVVETTICCAEGEFRILAFFPQFQVLKFCFEGSFNFFNFLHLDYFLCLQVQVVTDFFIY